MPAGSTAPPATLCNKITGELPYGSGVEKQVSAARFVFVLILTGVAHETLMRRA